MHRHYAGSLTGLYSGSTKNTIKKTNMKYYFIKTFVLCIASLTLLSFINPPKDKSKGKLVLKFNNLFNNENVEFGKEYTNAHGEKLTLKTLNYFISNIKLTLKNGSEYIVPQDSCYFLVKQSDKATQQIELNDLPEGKYKDISFMVGVDSTRNTMDASRRTGTLDVGGAAKGMYWAWNSGYIFFKMEGKSPVIPDSSDNSFFYHIGGFGGFQSPTISNIRTKSLSFNKPVSLKNKIPVVNINVDVATLFNYKTSILLAEHPDVMWGELSVKISENYISTFNLGSIDFVTATNSLQ